MVGVGGIDVDAAHEAVRVARGQAVEPRERHGARGLGVGVQRDEHAARAGGRPERRRVRAGALDGCHVATLPVRAVERARQPRGRVGPWIRQERERHGHVVRAERQPVAAEIVEHPEPLVAASPEGVDVRGPHAPRLGAPHVSEPDVHGSGHDRVGDDRDVERLGLAAEVDLVGDPVPVGDVALAEVHVGGRVEERVEAEVGVGGVEARLAAVADHRVLPLHRVARRLPGAVVLRAALQQVDVERAHREALELQRREPLVHALELRGHAREQLPAAAERGLDQRAAVGVVAPGRDVAKSPLERMTPPSFTSKNWNGLSGMRDDRVLVGMQAVRMVDVGGVHRHVRGAHAGVGREHDTALVRKSPRHRSTSRPRRRRRDDRPACTRSCRTSTVRCTRCRSRSPGWRRRSR